MLRDITLGQYYPAPSRIHALDPRVKLVATLLYIISLFLMKGIMGFFIATAFLAVVIRISHVPFSFMVRGLKAIFVLLVVTAIFNLIFTPGTAVFSVWIITVTREGVTASVYLLVRLIYLVVGTSLMTLTTTPNRLTDGLETLLSPLNRIHVPVAEIAMMMSIALRFIPILTEETDKIMKAQSARGADFENGNLIQKVRSLVPILVPLFVSAFRRANDLALAMEARCYRSGTPRTRMKPLVYVRGDRIAYGIIWAYLAIMILVRVFL